MERRVPIMEQQGARHFGDYVPYLRVGNIEIHRYVCFKCGHCETFHFDPKSMLRKPPQAKKK